MARRDSSPAMERLMRVRAANKAPAIPRAVVQQFRGLKHDFPPLRGTKLVPTRGRMMGTVPDEGNYTPQARADQFRRQVLWNVDQPRTRQTRVYQDQVVPHEMGHIYEPQVMTKALAALYQRRTNQVAGPRADPGGLSISGPGTTHDHPNERYASDVATALAGQGRLGAPVAAAIGQTRSRGHLVNTYDPREMANAYSGSQGPAYGQIPKGAPGMRQWRRLNARQRAVEQWMRARGLAPHSVGTGTLQYPGSWRI